MCASEQTGAKKTEIINPQIGQSAKIFFPRDKKEGSVASSVKHRPISYAHQNGHLIFYFTNERMIMNKQLLVFAFAICMGFAAAPLFAEVVPAPTPPPPITAPATTPAEHKAAAEVEKEHVVYHKGLAAHHRSLAAVYGDTNQHGLKRQHEALADKEDKIAKEHEKTAAEHEKLANPQ